MACTATPKAPCVHAQHIPPVSHWRPERIWIILNEEFLMEEPFNGGTVVARGRGGLTGSMGQL